MRVLRWDPLLAKDAAFPVDARAIRRAHVPTVFDDDQQPVRVLNRWLSVLSAQTNSRRTWWSYAAEVVKFANFLAEEFDVGLVDAELVEHADEMLRTYYLHLVEPDINDSSAGASRDIGDAASTLAKRRAAITSFYRWASSPQAGLLMTFPFATKIVSTPYGTRFVLAGLSGGRRTEEERYPIPGAQIERFFSVGLLGMLPSGEPDPTFRKVETSQRNAAGIALSIAVDRCRAAA